MQRWVRWLWIRVENASQKILDSELKEGVISSFSNVRDDLKASLKKIEIVMNTLSLTLDFPKLIVSSGQIDIGKMLIRGLVRLSIILKLLILILICNDGWRLKDCQESIEIFAFSMLILIF